MNRFTHTKTKDALSSLILSHAFFASLILQHEIVETKSVPTFCTNGKVLKINPEFADKQSHDELKFILAHEAAHVALLHHVRQGTRNHKLWNEAADYAINGNLVKSGMKMPAKGLLNARFDNMNAEDIYRQLEKEEEEKRDNKGGGKGKPQDGQGGQPQKGQGPAEPGQGEAPEPSFGEVEAPADVHEAEEETKVMVSQATSMAKRCGKMPASFEKQIDEAKEQVTSSREILARFVEETSNRDYSMLRPNKRFLGAGIVLPSLYSKEIGGIVLGCDTSGSISAAETRKQVSWLLDILSIYAEGGTAAKLTVIYCDAEVKGVQVLESEDDTIQPKGGGGTNFAPIFAEIEKEGMNPRAVVVMTDGYCNSFGQEPACPVLWGLVVSNPGFKPPFGEVFNINFHES